MDHKTPLRSRWLFNAKDLGHQMLFSPENAEPTCASKINHPHPPYAFQTCPQFFPSIVPFLFLIKQYDYLISLHLLFCLYFIISFFPQNRDPDIPQLSVVQREFLSCMDFQTTIIMHDYIVSLFQRKCFRFESRFKYHKAKMENNIRPDFVAQASQTLVLRTNNSICAFAVVHIFSGLSSLHI